MKHRVNILLNSSQAHSLEIAEQVIASVWVLLIVLAKASEKRHVFNRRLPVTSAAK